MDSRIMFERQMDEWGFICQKNKNGEYKSPRVRQWWGIWRTAQEKMRALLTAEPEPCEDAKDFAFRPGRYGPRSRLIYKGKTKDMVEVAEILDDGLYQSYATQVADKRAEENKDLDGLIRENRRLTEQVVSLQDQVETLRGALVELRTSYNVNCNCGECKRKRKLSDEALAATEPKL